MRISGKQFKIEILEKRERKKWKFLDGKSVLSKNVKKRIRMDLHY